MSFRGRVWRAAAGGLALAVILPLAAEAGPYRRGELVTVRGTVRDAAGAPLGGVTVLLEASRRSFKLSRVLRRQPAEKTDTLAVPAAADAAGQFAIEWLWDPYYNVFELALALPVERPGRDAFEVFHRVDVTERMRQGGNPVDFQLTVEDSPDVRWLKRFLDGRASADERRTFRERGRPDKVDTRERSGGPETSWWYFEDGKVYRFVGGSLSGVDSFEPIPPVP